MQKIIQTVARRVNLSEQSVEATAKLLDEGATVPFICRYRKELTGSLDEVQVRAVEAELKSVRELEARKQFVREAVEKAGGLTPELERKIAEAQSATEI